MNYKSIAFKFFYLLSRKQKKELFFVFSLLFIGTLMEMIGIGVLVPLFSLFSGVTDIKYINYIVQSKSLSYETIILYLISSIVFFYFIKFLFLIFLTWKQSSFISNLALNLTSDLFKGYLEQPYLFHIQNNSSILLRNLQSELGQFTTYVQAAVLLLLELMTIIGIGSVLIYNQPMAAFISASFLLIVVYFFNKFTKNKILTWGTIRQYQAEKITKQFIQGLGGIKEIKFFQKEAHFFNQVEEILKVNANISTKYLTIGQLPRYFLEFMALLGIFIIVIVMQIKGLNSQSIFPILGLYLAASFRIIPSINRVLNSIQTMKYLNPVIDVLYKEFKLINNTFDNSIQCQDISFNNEIKFDKICFRYPDTKKNNLNDFSIRIKKGQTVGIIGKSGSGKSTLIDILLGLYQPESGQILVDGIDINKNIRSWQKKIGYVPQNVFLLDDTVEANVAFGIDKNFIDQIAVKNALKSAQLSDFINSVVDGENSIVGERGVKISGGQKQRIGIARALYFNPEILVLDEATSALDNENEANFMNTILMLKNSKTIFIVAHRLSTLKSCDIIFEISNGNIVKHYDPKELLR
jgi:ABC-type multidrug transport system fused ATPase/permease subunit